MSTSIEICNLALSKLGDQALITTITPPHTSAQSEHCALFYPIALQDLMDAHAWSFATKRATLVATTNTDARWLYCYTLPTDFNAILSVFHSAADDPLRPTRLMLSFTVSTNSSGVPVLYTNQDSAAIEYTKLITDTTLLSPSVRNALIWLLASYLAGPLLKGDVGVSAALKFTQGYQMALSIAKESDGQDRRLHMVYVPSGIACRIPYGIDRNA